MSPEASHLVVLGIILRLLFGISQPPAQFSPNHPK
jgi:hypothetical protein